MLNLTQTVMSKTIWAVLVTILINALQKYYMILPDDLFHDLNFVMLAIIGGARVANTVEQTQAKNVEGAAKDATK